jgi:hypothetical protein
MIELDKKLHKDIKEYCQLNGLVMKDFVNKLLKKAFMIEKYGDKPFAEPKMSNLEKEAIEKIKDMVEGQVDLPIEIAEAMEEVDFFELLGDEKNEVQAILPVDYKMPEPIKPTLPVDYKMPEPIDTVVDISKKEVPNNFYGLITEIEPNGKIGENTEIVDMRSVISDGNDDKIILQPSKDGKSLVSHPETESVQEEIKVVRKKKRKLN